MARYEVTGPDGSRYEINAPDDATEQQVMAYAQQQFASAPQQSRAPRTQAAMRSLFVGPQTIEDELRQGIVPAMNPRRRMTSLSELKDAAIGAADVTQASLRGMVNKPAASLGGLVGAINPNDTYAASRERYQRAIENNQGIIKSGQLRTPQGERAASGLNRAMRTTYIPQALEKVGGVIGSVFGEDVKDFAGSAAGVASFGIPRLAAVARTPTTRATPQSAPRPPSIPTTENLKAAADIAYKVADDSGVVVSRESFAKVVDDIRTMLANKAVDETLHPDTLAAFKRLERQANDTSVQGVSLKGLDTLRQVINDARQGLPRDASKASAMLERFDDYMDNLSQSDLISGSPRAAEILSNARGLWSRYRKSEDITELTENAKLTAGGYSNANFENALRIEFKKLALNKDRMRRFTPEEQAAIRRAATVDAGDFAIRLLGKLAIRGPISGAVTLGSGSAIGGPAGAVLMAGAGEIGALGSRMRRVGKARAVDELVRRGPRNALMQTAQPPSNALTVPSNRRARD